MIWGEYRRFSLEMCRCMESRTEAIEWQYGWANENMMQSKCPGRWSRCQIEAPRVSKGGQPSVCCDGWWTDRTSKPWSMRSNYHHQHGGMEHQFVRSSPRVREKMRKCLCTCSQLLLTAHIASVQRTTLLTYRLIESRSIFIHCTHMYV